MSISLRSLRPLREKRNALKIDFALTIKFRTRMLNILKILIRPDNQTL